MWELRPEGEGGGGKRDSNAIFGGDARPARKRKKSKSFFCASGRHADFPGKNIFETSSREGEACLPPLPLFCAIIAASHSRRRPFSVAVVLVACAPRG